MVSMTLSNRRARPEVARIVLLVPVLWSMMVAPSEGLDRSILERSCPRHGTIVADCSELVWLRNFKGR
jgi:hypothetical protein